MTEGFAQRKKSIVVVMEGSGVQGDIITKG